MKTLILALALWISLVAAIPVFAETWELVIGYAMQDKFLWINGKKFKARHGTCGWERGDIVVFTPVEWDRCFSITVYNKSKGSFCNLTCM